SDLRRLYSTGTPRAALSWETAMKHHLHLLLAASLGSMSIGAAAAVHDWTASRIGEFEGLAVADMNNAGQVAFGGLVGDSGAAFLYTSGSSGGLVDLGFLGGRITEPWALNASGEVVGKRTPFSTATER